MSLRVADLLKLPSFSSAEVLNGKKGTGHFIRALSTDPSILDDGVLYAVERKCINLDVFIKNHPDAAGFLVPLSCACSGKSSLPVIGVPDIAQCISDYQSSEKGIPLAAELYTELKENAKDFPEALKLLSQKLGCELYLADEKNTLAAGSKKITKKAFEELKKNPSAKRIKVWAENEWNTLICEGNTQIDSYLLTCASQALTGLFARFSRVRTAVITGIGHLIYDGEAELASFVAAQCRIPLPPQANVWMLYGQEGANVRPWVASIREFCRSFGTVYLLGAVGNDLLLVMEKSAAYKAELHHMEALADFCRKSNIPLTLVSGLTLSGENSSIRVLKECLCDQKTDLEQIFPDKGYYTVSDMFFAQECRRIILQGSDELNRYRSLIQTLIGFADEELVNTLAVYFIDEAMSVTETADRLFLHRNTVKYRLQKTEDILSMNLSDATVIRELVTALGIHRLLG